MNSLNIPKQAQIAGLLSGYLMGIDGWRAKYLGSGVRTADVPFSAVFTVKPAEVVEHVMQHGWDRRYVKTFDELPSSSPEDDANVFGFVGQAQDGGWEVMLPLDQERHSDRFRTLRFDSQLSMVRWVVDQLMDAQRARYG